MEDFYYRKLKVYQESMALLREVYQLSEKFPARELHGLTNQIQRAAVSIPSNIAEGMGRFSFKERIRFIEISNGSLMEVMCQLEIANQLGHITDNELKEKEIRISEIAKMMIGLRRNLEEKIKQQ